MANTSSARKATRKSARFLKTAIIKARRAALRDSVLRVWKKRSPRGDPLRHLTAIKDAEPAILRTAQRGVVHKILRARNLYSRRAPHRQARREVISSRTFATAEHVRSLWYAR